MPANTYLAALRSLSKDPSKFSSIKAVRPCAFVRTPCEESDIFGCLCRKSLDAQDNRSQYLCLGTIMQLQVWLQFVMPVLADCVFFAG